MGELKLAPELEESTETEKRLNPLAEGENPEEQEDKVCEAFEKSEENFSDFKQFMKKNPMVGQMMIKRWINQPNVRSMRALSALGQTLPDSDLMSFFSGLNQKEKEKWRSFFKERLSGKELYAASLFIAQEMKRGSIAPDVVKDSEIIDILMNMTLDQSLQFLSIKSEYQKVYAHLVPAETLAKVIGRLKKEEAKELIREAVNFNLQEVQDNFAGFKTFLQQFYDKFKNAPFSEQLLQILPGFNPNKEHILYKHLAAAKRIEDMKLLAHENLPAELILKMPKEFLKLTMQDYPGNKKIMLLASLDEKRREKLLGSFAEEGSAARELVDMEFENLKADPKAQSMIKTGKDEIWREFVLYAREKLKGEAEFESEAEMLINSWAISLDKKSDVA